MKSEDSPNESKSVSRKQGTKRDPTLSNKVALQQLKVHRGLYINNQRRKGGGGRIKSESIDCKIQVLGKANALHQSVVEWVQIRRYVKGSNHPKKNQDKQRGNKQAESSLHRGNPKNHQKYQGSNKPKYQQVKQQSKKPKYLAKSQTQNKQQNQKKQLIACKTEQIIEQKRQEQKDKGQFEKQAIQQQKKSDSSQSQQEKEQQVIVAEIIRQVETNYLQKPFVGLLYFKDKQQKSKQTKQRFQAKQKTEKSIFEIIVDRYEIQIFPINRRLQVMNIDSIFEKKDAVHNYIEQQKIIDQNMKKSQKINCILQQLQDMYILGRYTGWRGQFPRAEIIKIIGRVNTVNGQCASFLYEFGLNDFQHDKYQGEKIMEIKPNSLHIPLQNRMVFTIDPKTSVDLDDALSIQKVDNDLYEIGIHIADVTSYLSQIPREQLIKRTTSVYLPHKTYHMLPQRLMKVCTLNPNVKRLAFSIYVRMQASGKIVGESRIQKNIIVSRFKLAYEQVQDVITGKSSYQSFKKTHQCSEQEYETLTRKLILLTNMAVAHRKQRVLFEVFDNKQIKFQLDQQNWPCDFSVERRFTAKKVVQQYMIIGNVEAAKHLVKYNAQRALIIHHPPPTNQSVDYFNNNFDFKDKGIVFQFKSIRQAENQLLMVQQHKEIPEQIKQLCYFKARRTQEAALYQLYSEAIKQQLQQIKEQSKQSINKKLQDLEIKERGRIQVETKGQQESGKIIHFALGLQYYTHFTSPMRRMADIMVHQALNCLLVGKQVPEIPLNQIERINFGRTATKRLKRDLTDIYLALLVRKSGKQIETQGIIASFGMQSGSIFIPLFDTMKQIMWRSELQIVRVYRRRGQQNDKKNNKKDIESKANCEKLLKQQNKNEEKGRQQQSVRLYSHYDDRSAKNDVFWDVTKFQKVKVFIGCTKDAPIRPRYKLQVKTNKGLKFILPNVNL